MKRQEAGWFYSQKLPEVQDSIGIQAKQVHFHSGVKGRQAHLGKDMQQGSGSIGAQMIGQPRERGVYRHAMSEELK